MKIIVTGEKSVKLMPNLMKINFVLEVKGETSREALQKGSADRVEFITTLTQAGNFAKQDIKTSNFFVREDKQYDEKTKRYVLTGFIYSESFEVIFDFNSEKFLQIVSALSRLKNSPSYTLSYLLREDPTRDETLYAEAFKNAKIKAEILARADGKIINKCKKISLVPIHNEDIRLMRTNAIAESFTPKEIEISKVVYCVFETD